MTQQLKLGGLACKERHCIFLLQNMYKTYMYQMIRV